MARIAGRNGSLYLALTSGGTAEPVAYLDKWSLSFAVGKIDVTAFGDTSQTYVASLPDCQGTYSGFYDTATVQMYSAASDGVARKFYVYPVAATVGQYWFGTGIFDMSIDATVDGAVAISGSFAASSTIPKVG